MAQKKPLKKQNFLLARAEQLAPVPAWRSPRTSWVVLFPLCLLVDPRQVAALGFGFFSLRSLQSAGERDALAPVSPGPAEERKLRAVPKLLFFFFLTIFMKNTFFFPPFCSAKKFRIPLVPLVGRGDAWNLAALLRGLSSALYIFICNI